MEFKGGRYGKQQPDRALPNLSESGNMDPKPRRETKIVTSDSQRRKDFDTIPHEIPGNADLFQTYLGDIREIIARYPLLSAEQEVALAQKIQQGKEEIKIPETHRDQKVIQDAREAKTTLIYSNLRGALDIALKIWRTVPKGNIHQLMDLVQEGNLELTRTAETYDPEKGNRFSTLAFTNMELAMKRELARKGYVHVETNKLEKHTKIKKMLSTDALTLEEVAQKLGMEVSKVQELMKISNITVESLNTPVNRDYINGEDDNTLGGVISAEESGFDQAEEKALRKELLMFIKGFIKKAEFGLTQQEYAAIEARMKLHIENGKAPVLQEVGRELGVSYERVRQLLVSGEEKLKSQSDEAKAILQEFYDEL